MWRWGRTVAEAAGITGVRPWSVYGWVRTYVRIHRPDSLRDGPRSLRQKAERFGEPLRQHHRESERAREGEQQRQRQRQRSPHFNFSLSNSK